MSSKSNSEDPFFRKWKLISSDGEKPVFALSRIIASRPDMVGAVIYGMQRSGKTMYSLLVMYDIYRDWDKVLSNVFFNLEELLGAIKETLKNFGSEKQLKVICWDDAGVHGSKYIFFRRRIGRRLTEYLQNLFDVVGLVVKAILITTPNPQNILKAIREYEFYRVQIVKLQNGNRIARGYRPLLLPSGQTRILKEFEDYYNIYIPDDVYKEYVEKRKSYLEEVVERMEEFLKGGDDEEEVEEEREGRRRKKGRRRRKRRKKESDVMMATLENA